jgi:hypothetical protein
MAKWILPSVVMAMASAAWADATVPGAGAAGGAPWQERCAARLEAARDAVAPGFGTVTVSPRELDAPGDPTAHAAVDTVEYSVFARVGTVLVRVQPWAQPAERRWTPWQGSRATGDGHYSVFHHHGGPWAQAWIQIYLLQPGFTNAAALDHAMMHAVDDCLAMRRLQ